MKKTAILLTLVFIFSAFLTSTGADKDYKKVLGTWVYSAPSAPYPYSDGTIILKEVDNKLTGELSVQGNTVPIPEVTFVDGTLTLKMEVEYNPVETRLKLEKGELVGTSESPSGPISITAKKKE